MTTMAEAAAVALALAYLLLAIRQNVLCWPAAIASAAIYVYVMLRAGLYMESALQWFYIGMAVYGWWKWHHGTDSGGQLRVTSWPPVFHLLAVTLIGGLSLVSGYLLEAYTSAAFPYADSFTTWGAIVTTWMVANKILENWVYWFVIDSVALVLFVDRALWLTAALFAVYLVLIVFGYRAWRRSLIE